MVNSQIVKDYSEYSGLSLEQIVKNTEISKIINCEDFHKKGDPKLFYETSDTYIYDLLHANHDENLLTRKIDTFSPGFLYDVSSRKSGNFLEFGGGLGVFCEIIKKRTNLDVTYCDIKTRISDFTLWRYDKYKVPISSLIIPQEDFSLPEKYDVIFTDAVIEHLPSDQQEAYIRKLGSHLKTSGVLCLLIDLEGHNEEMPMHNDVDIMKLHSLLQEDGLICVYGKNTFSSRWVKL